MASPVSPQRRRPHLIKTSRHQSSALPGLRLVAASSFTSGINLLDTRILGSILLAPHNRVPSILHDFITPVSLTLILISSPLPILCRCPGRLTFARRCFCEAIAVDRQPPTANPPPPASPSTQQPLRHRKTPPDRPESYSKLPTGHFLERQSSLLPFCLRRRLCENRDPNLA